MRYIIAQLVKHHTSIHTVVSSSPIRRSGGRRSPAVACWASDHWVASSNPLGGQFRQ